MSNGTSDAPYEAKIDSATNAAKCMHGLSFDEGATARLSAAEVAKRWPRLDGPCPLGCGYCGLAYASFTHYVAGDW